MSWDKEFLAERYESRKNQILDVLRELDQAKHGDYISQARLIELTGIPDAAVRSAINDLIESGRLAVDRSRAVRIDHKAAVISQWLRGNMGHRPRAAV